MRFLIGAGIVAVALPVLTAAEDPPLPSQLSPEQQGNLLEFLKAHRTPERYVPKNAKMADTAPPAADLEIAATKEKPIKQYIAQITPHRPTPDQPMPSKADVYFYRPNPEKGKHGITVKHTVDLATGKQIGETEVLTQAHTPVSREELAEAVAAAKTRSDTVKALYKNRDEKAVRWEYLQMKINRKSEQFEPGDRVVRFVFTAEPADGEAAPTPVRILVNLTKDTVIADDR
jgi:hypothetical protein